EAERDEAEVAAGVAAARHVVVLRRVVEVEACAVRPRDRCRLHTTPPEQASYRRRWVVRTGLPKRRCVPPDRARAPRMRRPRQTSGPADYSEPSVLVRMVRIVVVIVAVRLSVVRVLVGVLLIAARVRMLVVAVVVGVLVGVRDRIVRVAVIVLGHPRPPRK